MHTVLAVVALFVLVGTLHCQQPWLPAHGEGGGQVAGLVRDSSGRVLAQSPHMIFASTDNGAVWSAAYQPPVGIDSFLRAHITIASVSARGTVIGGINPVYEGGQFIRSEQGSANYAVVDSFIGDLVGVTALPSGVLWAASNFEDGADGIYRSTDDGRTWTRRISPDDTSYFSMRAMCALDDSVILVGFTNGLYRSTDAAATWQYSFPRKVVLWIHQTAGGVVLVGMQDSMYISLDRGVTWSSEVASFMDVTGFLGRSNGRSVIATTTGLYETVDDGHTWSTLLPRGCPGGVTTAADGTLLAGTRDGVWALRTSDTNWSPMRNGYEAMEVNGLVVGTGGHVYASTDATGLLISDDNGETWRRTGLPKRVMGVLETRSGAILAHVGDSLGTTKATTRRSTDNGVTWTTADGLDEYHRQKTGFVEMGDNGIFRISDYGIYRSTDDGLSWSKFRQTTGGLRAMMADSTGLMIYADGAGLSRSSDWGVTWKATGDSVRTAELEVDPHGAIYALSDSGVVRRSNDRGLSWSRLSDRGLPLISFYRLPWLRSIGLARDGRLFGAGAVHGLFVFEGDSIGWKPAGSGLEEAVVNVLVETPDGALLVGTADAGIFRRSAAPLTVRVDRSETRAAAVVRPNPASTLMRIALPNDLTGHVTVDLRTALGERVALLADDRIDGMEPVIVYDASSLAPGVYFCHIADARGVATTRVVVVR